MDTLSLIDPDGDEYAFDTDLTFVEWPLVGRMGATYEFYEQAYAQNDGSSVGNVRALPGTLKVPFSVHVPDNYDIMRDLVDTWNWRLDPERGRSILRSTRSSGVQRDYYCRYRSGLEKFEESPQTGQLSNALLRVPLEFGGGPFWLDTNVQSDTFTPGSSGRKWLPVSFPWYLSDSTLFASKSISNFGQKQARPTWTIYGPATNLRLTNDTTGKTLLLNYSIAQGERIVIDTTEPGFRTIRSDVAGNLMRYRVGTLWPLAAGDNQVTVSLDGGSSATSVQYQFRTVWPGA